MKTDAIPQRIARSIAAWSVLAAIPLLTAGAQAGVTVGLHFVDGQDEQIDFMTIPGFPSGNFIQPWPMTDPDTEFVSDGAFQGLTEQEARAAVVAAVKDRYYSIPAPQGHVLDINFRNGVVSGPGTLNVLIGKHNVGTSTWFGYSKEGGGLGVLNGESNSAISLDRINSQLQLDFVDLDDAINAISNTITHEIAHLFWLDHVWADARPDLGWQEGDPVVTNPYDVMATAFSGLPEAGWFEKNVFTTVPGTQAGGRSSVGQLIEVVGLRRVGDLNGDDDVDNQDILAVAGSFTGSGGTGKEWGDGDMDYDGDVDNADLVSVVGAFTGASAGNLVDGPNDPDLIYDPATGNVKVDASEAAGGIVTGFQLENAAGTFVPGNYISPGGNFGGIFEDLDVDVLADSDLTFIGFSGVHDFGNVFPTGLDVVALQAYLTTADYSAQLGSSGEFDLVIAGAVPFELKLEIAPVPTGFDLTWTNRDFKIYDLESCDDLASWELYDPNDNDEFLAIPYSDSDTNTRTIITPADPRLFFRVVENPEVLFSENFDGAGAIPADWTSQIGGTAPADTCVWEVGVPSSPAGSDGSVGPPAAFSGTHCAGTNIDFYCKRDDVFAAGSGGATNNDFESVEVSLITPAIPIPSDAPSARLSFRQFMDTPGRLYETASITVLDADNADAPISGLEISIPFGEDDTAWKTRTLDLPVLGAAGVAGKSIKVKFFFKGTPYVPNQGQRKLFVRTGTNPDFYSPTYTSSFGGGLYIDDVVISVPFVP